MLQNLTPHVSCTKLLSAEGNSRLQVAMKVGMAKGWAQCAFLGCDTGQCAGYTALCHTREIESITRGDVLVIAELPYPGKIITCSIWSRPVPFSLLLMGLIWRFLIQENHRVPLKTFYISRGFWINTLWPSDAIMLTYHWWSPVEFMCQMFHGKRPGCQLSKWDWKLYFQNFLDVSQGPRI